MALPQAIDIRISMLRLAPQCFAFTSSIKVVLLVAVLTHFLQWFNTSHFTLRARLHVANGNMAAAYKTVKFEATNLANTVARHACAGACVFHDYCLASEEVR